MSTTVLEIQNYQTSCWLDRNLLINFINSFRTIFELHRILRAHFISARVLQEPRTKQAVEVTFSRKKISADHPPVLFNNIPVIKMNEHKHLGIILDSKLSFATRIQSIILKCRRGLGMIKFLSRYLPRNTLTELYKLYVRPHLDYGDVIYHIPPKKAISIKIPR